MKRQRKGALVSTARATDTMNHADRLLSDDAGPDFMFEDRLYLRLIRQRVEERLNETQSDLAAFADEFQRCHVDIVSADLTVADYPVAGELKSGYTKIGDGHKSAF
jgi:hypothetical protein